MAKKVKRNGLAKMRWMAIPVDDLLDDGSGTPPITIFDSLGSAKQGTTELSEESDTRWAICEVHVIEVLK